MPEGVDHAAEAPPVLLGDGVDLSGAGRLRPLHGSVRIADDEQHPDLAAADRLRTVVDPDDAYDRDDVHDGDDAMTETTTTDAAPSGSPGETTTTTTETTSLRRRTRPAARRPPRSRS